jgi:uncharacterized protein YidB (DUF937 family)
VELTFSTGVIMGLLDGALNAMLGGGAPAGNVQNILSGVLNQLGGTQGSGSHALVNTALSLLQQNGGLDGLVNKFRANGLGSVVDSWVGTGANAPVSGPQLQQVFGHDMIQQIASHLGTDPQAASAKLASVLPELVNQMTPNGHIPTNSGDLLSLLKANVGELKLP